MAKNAQSLLYKMYAKVNALGGRGARIRRCGEYWRRTTIAVSTGGLAQTEQLLGKLVADLRGEGWLVSDNELPLAKGERVMIKKDGVYSRIRIGIQDYSIYGQVIMISTSCYDLRHA